MPPFVSFHWQKPTQLPCKQSGEENYFLNVTVILHDWSYLYSGIHCDSLPVMVHILLVFQGGADVFNVGLQQHLQLKLKGWHVLPISTDLWKWDKKREEQPNINHFHIRGHWEGIRNTDKPEKNTIIYLAAQLSSYPAAKTSNCPTVHLSNLHGGED